MKIREAELKIGDKYRLDYGKDSIATKKVYHVRGFVDGNMVTKQWMKHKQYWYYEVHNPYLLEWQEGSGKIKKV